MYMKTFLTIILYTIALSSFAKLTTQLGFNYTTDTDTQKSFEYSKLNGALFIGASVGKKDKLYIGQNVSKYTRTDKQDGLESAEIGVLEIGPKLLYYFNEDKNIFFSGTWNPYAKGERKDANTNKISGWSYNLALGYHLKINRFFYLGASLNYHNLNITTETDSSNQETEVSQTFTSIFPLIELVFHFR